MRIRLCSFDFCQQLTTALATETTDTPHHVSHDGVYPVVPHQTERARGGGTGRTAKVYVWQDDRILREHKAHICEHNECRLFYLLGFCEIALAVAMWD